MPTATWRSVYSAQARTAEEILVDEIAKALGKDAVAMRRTFLKTDEARAVLNKVANEGNWGRAMSSVPLRAWRCMPSTARSRHASWRSTATAQSRASRKRSWHWTWGAR